MGLRRRRGLSRAAPSGQALVILLLIGANRTNRVDAVVPTASLRVSSGETAYAAPAWFGPQPLDQEDAIYMPLRVPSGEFDGCKDVSVDDQPTAGFALLVERGHCFFDVKALAAQTAGARGIVVMNSLRGIYQEKDAATNKYDYECSNGEGWVENLVSPLWSPDNTDEACWSNSACESGVCVVTNETDPNLGHKVCCAWDMYITMYGSDDVIADKVAIPTVYVTMADGKMLQYAGEVDVQLFSRPRSYINLSSFLLWALGVATVCWASVRSADDLRRRRKTGVDPDESTAVNSDHHSEESPYLELGVRHTLAFVVFASVMLLLLFFFNLSFAATLLFCLSGTTATATVIVLPALRRLRSALAGPGLLCRADADSGTVDCACFGVLSWLEIVSTLASLALAVWWLIVRNTASYAWVIQDIFGVCLCTTFLATIRIPSIKVATFLLCLAFLYDIFWVFISPQLFGESVMVKVATGGEITKDPTFCEKYPTESGCQARLDTKMNLPMLLELPRLWDYTGGYAMLGLGDIVIPGLLLSFAHRYDVSAGLRFAKGYFVFMVAGYAVGLLMANMAVYVMGMGQPALLYLVPCTLGLFAFLAHSDGTLRNMWEGPASMNVEHLGYDGLLSEESTVGTKEGIGGLRGEHRYLGRVRGGSSSPLSTSGKRSELRGWGADTHFSRSTGGMGSSSGGWQGKGLA
ncbi:unnamed protein product [Ascophyllum nodosum]